MAETAARQPRAEAAPIRPAKLSHAVFRTAQVEAMVDWYKTVLQAEVMFQNARGCFLTYDDEHHRIAIFAKPGLKPKDRGNAGFEHLAFTYGELGDLLTTYDRLKSLEIRPGFCVNHGMTTSMYYADPDGNGVELQVDNMPTATEGKAWMRSAAFAENQTGIQFDPDLLLQKWRDGVPVQALLQQGSAPRSD